MKFLVTLSIAALLFSPVGAFAQTQEYWFNPHYIISDEELADVNALTLDQIQRFLEEKGSGLAARFLPDYTGTARRASEIIWNAAQESQVSPKVLLATLQKEQSLVSDPAPSARQLDRAMGYRCPDEGGCNASTLDFGKQVDGAAWQFRQYLDNHQKWNFRINGNYSIDGVAVSPATKATAALYNYTPHYSGNERFWRIWLSYWGKLYPEGALLKTPGNAGVWFIQNGERRLITNYTTFQSRFDARKILKVSRTDLEKYPVGPSLSFPNYSLLRTPDGKIYLLVDDERRHIVSPDVFRELGFIPDEVEEVNFEDLAGYTPGPDVTLASAYPTGKVLKNKDTGALFYVDAGVRSAIVSMEILRSRFSRLRPTLVSEAELTAYPVGEPTLFADGELVKSTEDNRVYVIAAGKRRWIAGGDVFVSLGYRWDNVVVTSREALELHTLGEDVK